MNGSKRERERERERKWDVCFVDWVRVCWRAAWVARQLSITPLSCRFPGGPHDKKLNRIGQFSIKKLKLKDLIVRYISQSSTFVNSNSYLPVVRSAFLDCLRLTPLIAFLLLLLFPFLRMLSWVCFASFGRWEMAMASTYTRHRVCPKGTATEAATATAPLTLNLMRIRFFWSGWSSA